jgi:3-oxoacyl-[acyl-carrier protein] reductase
MRRRHVAQTISFIEKARRRSMPRARKVALVSGGSRGLGAALVAGFLQRSYGVATMSRATTTFIAKTEADRQNRKHFYWTALDGRDHEALRSFVGEVAERFGRIDVLVNNAGLATEGVLPTMRPHDIVDVVEVNLTAALVLSQVCSRVMLRQGSGCIINISSINAVRGHPGVAVYSATKAALDGMTRSLARELGPRNIRVNSVAPGYFECAPHSARPSRPHRGCRQRRAFPRIRSGILYHRTDHRGRWRHHMLTTLTPERLQSVIHGKIGAILKERFGEDRPFSGSDKLSATLGLSSLDLAFLVADLEAEFGVDPFAKLVSITSIRSVDDLERAYRIAFFPETSPARQDDSLASAADRAKVRRARRERK